MCSVSKITPFINYLVSRMQVLDDMGDQNPSEKRRKYFEEIDEDGSGAIDFEEYMGVRD